MLSILQLILFLIFSFGISFSQINLTIHKAESRKLPQNTIDVIDFNTVIAIEENQLKLLDISNPYEQNIIYSFNIPQGKSYNSIQHGRYVILEGKHGERHFKTILDIQKDSLEDIEDLNGNIGSIEIAEKDGAVIYNVDYGSTIRREPGGLIREPNIAVKLKLKNGEIKLVTDSIACFKWSPDEEWFIATKYIKSDTNGVKWERALFNRDGAKAPLEQANNSYAEQVIISQAVWSPDGKYIAIPLLSGLRLAVYHLDWKDDFPSVIKNIEDHPFHSPVLFSPDGKYILFQKSYEDGHFIFGNDLLLTNVDLSFSQPIIEHNDISETALIWKNNELITVDALDIKNAKNIYKYSMEIKK